MFNDFSARDVQLDEMTSGFGPTKSKYFANSISNVVVSANDILPVIDQLRASVWINGEKIAENTTAGMHYSLPEAIAYASWEEELHPGEFSAVEPYRVVRVSKTAVFYPVVIQSDWKSWEWGCWKIKWHKNSESRILCESACKNDPFFWQNRHRYYDFH